jgi:hypothetical protein
MTTRIAILCAALAGALAAVPAAEAKKPKQPLYELTLSGSEAVAWQYKVPADGKCFGGAVGNGGQEVYYRTGKVKVRVIKSKMPGKKGLLQIAALNDKFAEYGFPQGIPAVVQVDRDGEIKSWAGCGGTGGSTQQPPPKDCGLRWGRIQLQVGYHALTAFSVSGHYDNFSRPAPGETDDLIPPPFPPKSGDVLGGVYENCAWILPSGMAPANDDLTAATKQLSVKRLPKKGKTLKISGGDRDEAADPDGQRKAETSVAWNLRLKRIR